MKKLMTLEEAAAETPFGKEHLRRCVHIKEPTATMPALRAKRDGKGRLMVTDTELLRWIDAQEDA